MIRLFDIADVNKSASAFNVEKLVVAQPAAHDACAARRASCRCCAGIWSGRACSAMTTAQLEQIVLAQRERAKTVEDMAAQQPVLLPAARRLR